ncbi:hypothetical protein KC343_g1232 [Hortaea werneckii]|uniref:Proteasome assembly chaperone 3 n=1 Tax=Hortaea werneckii TaxID=91943 RepID=A0A3M7F7G8_HORWE|nr:hypothetical protein KC338_g751 [Hortaea werneckii]KAI7277264.1 hypothetical protein KC352_g7817 [Hortaea werneckii]KAI7359070.1 hypothetical protein KC320_g762 [Hortaea werneckii]KAI7571674.1 hypothetical protein KC317_g1428 [Hortaea werneckii]KAI7626545.1 hypothetical protein KC346_g1211 [Hortaea werneckii]
MATATNYEPVVNGEKNSQKPIELAIALPYSPATRINIHLTILATTIMLFMTTSDLGSSQGGTAMGSLVYAMPDRYNPTQPMSTPIYSLPASLDFTTRLAKVLVRRTQKLCYVGGSVNLSNAANGGSVEEEMEAFRAIIDVVVAETNKAASV